MNDIITEEGAAKFDLAKSLEREGELGERLIALVKSGDPLHPDQMREWWAAVSVVFECMATAAMVDAMKTVQPAAETPYQSEAMFNFAIRQHTVAAHLAAGEVIDLVSAVRSRGRPPTGPLRAMLISWAHRYIRFAKEDRINGPHYIKTIMDAYGVDRTTAQGWGNSFIPLPRLTDPSPDHVVEKMRVSGEKYRRTYRDAD